LVRIGKGTQRGAVSQTDEGKKVNSFLGPNVVSVLK